MLAPEVEFGNSPGRTEADDSIDDDGGDRGDQGQAQGRQDVWCRQGLYVEVPAFGQRVGEDDTRGRMSMTTTKTTLIVSKAISVLLCFIMAPLLYWTRRA